ncbi:MAG: hypothetical protein KAT77_05245 [Nanoarchaeota archaeon]|nr:hypothetical protein [Nanoarchaeota archaeon]
MVNQIIKYLTLIAILLLLSTSTFSQPASPGLPPFGQTNDTSTPTTTTNQTTNTTTTTTSIPSLTPTTQTSTSLEDKIDDLEAEIASLKSEIAQKKEPSSPFGYFIFLLTLDLFIIAAVIFLFLKHKIKKEKPIPESIKNYVKTNIQRGYPEGQIRLQLANQGWKPEQITRIFDEVHHGL